MSDDEDDYMSDKFLCGDVRPSLIQDRGKKRQVEVVHKQTEHQKRQRQERHERSGDNRNEKLQESLKRPIESTNKGFQMLAKMGYTPGQSLGKAAASEECANSSVAETVVQRQRLLEPIGLTIKNDRGGLGREAALRELTEKRQLLRRQRIAAAAGGEVLTTEEFRRRVTQKVEERFVHGALRRCQLTCENVDTEAGVALPELPWFWPERLVENNEEDEEKNSDDCQAEADREDDADAEEESNYTDSEKLEMLTTYLRTSYLFCFWCGVRYKDAEDMETNCPGLTKDEH